MTFVKWPSINKFSDVYHHAHRNGVEVLHLRGKIKLHGTNAGIRVTSDGLVGQKRSGDVSIGNDNAGFAAWLDTLKDWVFPDFNNIVVYGEWAGPGIQKGDAVAAIGSKKFFVFAAYDSKEDEYLVEPDELKILCDAIFDEHPDIIVLPWYTERVVLNMMDQEACQEFITDVTAQVDEVIANEDPYIKETFGVSGPGEGLVFYATNMEDRLSEFLFKVKSEAHTVNKSKQRDHVAPEKPEGVDEFIEMFFTEARFQQMLDEHLDGVADRKRTGDFLKAVMSDVHKESVNEMELVDFEWKDVAKYAVVKTKAWLFQQETSISG